MRFLSVRPYRGIDFGHIRVTELLHGLFGLVLAGRDIHSEHKREPYSVTDQY